MKSNKLTEQYADTEIISRIIGGETALFEIIIRRYNSYLFKVGRSYNFSSEDTQDLMQDTYLSCFSGLKQFEGRSSFKTWIVKIMLHHCYQRRKKFSFQYEVVQPEVAQDNVIPMFMNNNSDTNRTIMNKELGQVLEEAIRGIPEDYRIVFSLRELNGMSVAETAEVLNLSEANVKTRLSRAKGMLRTEIEKMYQPQEIFEFNLVYCDRMVERVMSRIGN